MWTPVLVALYANELQKLVAASMGWEMKAIEYTNPEVVKFSHMLNEVVHGTLPPEASPAAAQGAAAGQAAGAAAQ